jgi:hypothetical protein
MSNSNREVPSGLPRGRATGVITVRVPIAVYDRIVKVVEAEGITIADWTRDALLNAVRRAERQQRREEREEAE